MIVGVVLAAGESKRMGQPKALLKIGERTFLEHITTSLSASQLNLIYVVLGDQAEVIQSSLQMNVSVIQNPDFRQGQISSLKAAIEKIQFENCDGALVTLVDHPFLSPPVVQKLVEQFYASKKRIIVPTFHGKRGHPVIYSREVFADILSVSLSKGANTIREAHLDHTLELEVEDPGVLIDIDTPQDYERYITSMQAALVAEGVSGSDRK